MIKVLNIGTITNEELIIEYNKEFEPSKCWKDHLEINEHSDIDQKLFVLKE